MWTEIEDSTLSRFLPGDTDAGQYLGATVSYTDGHGPGKSAVVIGVPSVPGNFAATRANGQMSLSWSAASANGSDIDHYQTRYKTTSGGSWPSWSTVSGGALRRAPARLGPRILQGDFAPGFMVRLQQKDLKLVLESAKDVKLALPAVSIAHQYFNIVERMGCADEGTQVLIKAYEAQARKEARS